MLRHLVRRMGGGVGRLLTTPSESGGLTTEALVERTGIGQAGSLFTGSRGGGEEERLRRELEPFEEQAGTESYTRKRDADRFLLQVKKLTPDEKADALFDAYSDEKLGWEATADALREITAEQKGLKKSERFLLYANNTSKALYLLSKPEAEREKLIDDWYGRGLLDEGVFNEIGRIEYERDAANQPQLPAAAAPKIPPPVRQKDKKLNLNERINNPLNLKDMDGEFREFATPEEGWRAGVSDLRRKLTGESRLVKATDPLEKLFEVWAPASDPGNDPGAYAEYVATRLGVPRTTPMSSIEPRLEELASAMAEFEGWRLGGPPLGVRVKDLDEDTRRMLQILKGGK